MIPARDRTNYRGTVFLNPGGPGGSGTADDFIGLAGPNISTVVGDSFDVLGFDPRGVGASTPRLDCVASKAERDIWSAQEGHQLLNASDSGVLAFYDARAKVVGERCAQRSGEQGDIARFMDTASVATDMLHIVEKLGQEKLQYWGFVSCSPSQRYLPPAVLYLTCVPSSELRHGPWAIFRGHVP